MQSLPVIALTPGEPAGIGPDLIIKFSRQRFNSILAVVGDPDLIASRARQLNIDVKVEIFRGQAHRPGRLCVYPVSLKKPCTAGVLDPANSDYVLKTIEVAVKESKSGLFDALVTGPVHKGVINDSGRHFTGHTEFLAELTNSPQPVMLFVGKDMLVALLTTHLSLADVPKSITRQRVEAVIRILDQDIRKRFAISSPRINVCGLNPHAGESGHLGREEINAIAPVIKKLKASGLNVNGPLPADTAFLPSKLEQTDVTLAMYHDQGLPVVKHHGFGQAVNVTLGLPLIRTSVDHGTALDLAGKGNVDCRSLKAAMDVAIGMVNKTIKWRSELDQANTRLKA